MEFFFPTEIITIILSNLPSKSIFKCRSVCKTWRKIIDNPSFPDLHLNSSGNKSSSFIFQSSFCHEIYIATQDDNLPNTYNTRKFDFTYNLDCKVYTKPPVNGILFFHTSKLSRKIRKEDDNCCMFVFNPATQEFRDLPNFSLPPFTIARLILGFGFDEGRNVFKVVLMFLPMGNRAVQSDVQVLTLGCNLWRSIGKAPTMGFINDSSAFVNGALHWLAKKDMNLDLEEGSIGFSFKVYIVTFHMGCEEFGVIPSPELCFLGNDNSSRFQLVVLGGCLSVVDSSQNEVIEIWIMKDYNANESWMRYRISKYDLNGVLYKTIFPLSFQKNGDIVLLYGMKLIVYNTEDENYISLELKGLPKNSLPRGIMSLYFSRAFSCVESLIPLKRACTVDGTT